MTDDLVAGLPPRTWPSIPTPTHTRPSDLQFSRCTLLNATHRSAIARRLDKETGVGYQKALLTVREQADDLLRQLPVERLDGPGCDLLLRTLMQQDIEFWGRASAPACGPSPTTDCSCCCPAP